MNRKNNSSKSRNFEVFPKDNKKCFFVMEEQFQVFEKRFLQNQLRKRTNLIVASKESLDLYGVDFLIWFTKNIQGDLNPFGEAMSRLVHAKLKLQQSLRNDFTMEEKNALLDDVEKLLK